MGLGELTQRAYLDKVEISGGFLGKSPMRGKAQDANLYLHQLIKEKGLQVPMVSQHATALKTFFTITLDRP